MISQLTIITADQQRADVLAAGARSRRAALASRAVRSDRPRRAWRHLRRRAAAA